MVKNPPANARDMGLIHGLERSPGGGNGTPIQYFCLENPKDRGAWQSYTPWGHKESDTTQRLSACACMCVRVCVHTRTRTHTHTHLDNTVLRKGHRCWNQIVLGPTLPVLFLSWVIMESY